jgi:hypothetical protein
MIAMPDPLDDIRLRDELLQILFWFRGEGLGDAVTPRDLTTFLGVDADPVQRRLERLVEEGYVDPDPGGERYSLTAWGIKEGGRRFADEFAGLTGQAHGECNNPNCACQTEGPQACEARVAHAH